MAGIGQAKQKGKPMTKPEITRKIIEIARDVADPGQDQLIFRNAGRLEVLFEQLDAIDTKDAGKE